MDIKLWYSKDLRQWRWTLLNPSTNQHESGQHYGLRHAMNGITVPEQFVNKVKKQFENYKKLKLELGFSEQEAKDFKKSVVPEEEIKKLSTKIFKK